MKMKNTLEDIFLFTTFLLPLLLKAVRKLFSQISQGYCRGKKGKQCSLCKNKYLLYIKIIFLIIVMRQVES
jgi:hypothetical protein